jgi:hypothetical protein
MLPLDCVIEECTHWLPAHALPIPNGEAPGTILIVTTMLNRAFWGLCGIYFAIAFIGWLGKCQVLDGNTSQVVICVHKKIRQ